MRQCFFTWAALTMTVAQIGAATSGLVAAEADSAAQPAAEHYLFFGDCHLSKDPKSIEAALWFKLCLRATVGAETTFVTTYPDENSWLRYGNAYAGLHLTNWLSLHAQGTARDLLPNGEKGPEDLDRHSDFAVVRIGNPVLHKFRLTAGKMRLPFGIDHGSATQFYQTFENRVFWDSPRDSAVLAFDDQKSLELDVGYGTNEYSNREVKHGSEVVPVAGGVPPDPNNEGNDSATSNVSKAPLNRAVSARLMYDMAALDGSRLLLST